jgi:DNA-binding PadR family transcriptional regulator
MSQTLMQPQQSATVTDAVEEFEQAAPRAWRQPSRELLTAWLLLLLEDQAIHGYELRRRLELHGVITEPGAMYRMLRKLERDGCAASSWAKSIAGPRRRLYELTAKGRRELERLVGSITATRDVHAAFLRVHEGAPR